MKTSLMPLAASLWMAALLFGVSGCASDAPATVAAVAAPVSATVAVVNADMATAQKAVGAAVTFYGIVKGIAEVAEVADPALAPAVNATIAKLDPIVAQATAAAANAATDVATLTALATQISAQAQSLAVSAAPSVVVAPSS